jgi:glycosyltransferase involved in cell wall biosynthesis
MSVSVVMSVFNGGSYLKAAIESVLAQSLSPFEFVIVDDGSTDGSNRIIREFARNHSNIVLIEQENRGLPAALNRGIEQAQHNLIARMDADDIMMPMRLERQLSFLEQHPDVSVACSHIHLINKDGLVRGISKPQFPPADRISIEPRSFLAFSHSSVMMKKQDVLSAGGYRDEFFYAEDQDLWARLIVRGCRIAVQPEFLMMHRVYSSSVSMRNLARQHLLCDLVYSNLKRSMAGQEELSLEEFVANRARRPFLQKAGDWTEFLWQYHYKKSRAAFAEGNWRDLIPSIGTAFALHPVRTARRVLSRRAGDEQI